MDKQISSRQLMTLSLVAMISPFFRLLPGLVSVYAGSAGWLSAALAIVPLLFLSLILSKLLSYYPQFYGLGEVVISTLGKPVGKLTLFIWSMWLLLHSGFIICSGSDRFVATIYPNANPQIFISVMLLICGIAALKHVGPLARASEIFKPLLLGVILFVIIFSLNEVNPTYLLPVTPQMLPGTIKAAPVAAEVIGIVLVNAAFLSGHIKPDQSRQNRLLWLVGVILLGVLVCIVTIGNLGETQAATMSYPFFVLLRDLPFLSGVDRIEAVIIALWLFPDFILVSTELVIVTDNLLLIFQTEEDETDPYRKPIAVVCCIVIAAIVAFSLASSKSALMRWADEIVPAVHLFWEYLVCPMLFIISALRRKF